MDKELWQRLYDEAYDEIKERNPKMSEHALEAAAGMRADNAYSDALADKADYLMDMEKEGGF